MNMAKRTLPLILVFLVLSFPVAAAATSYTNPPREVALYEHRQGKYAYGTDAAFYVYPSPPIENQHVSSVYVSGSDSTWFMAESGWYADDTTQTNRRPRFFSAWVTRGSYDDAEYEYAAPGNYKTQVSYSGGEWHWFINTERLHTPLNEFTHGYSLISSERWATGDDNRSHFWEIKVKGSAGQWGPWSDVWAMSDDDTQYNAYMNGIASDWFIRKP